MPYRLSGLAERDLEEIWSYVAEDASSATADRLIDAIIDRFDLLVEQPRMGRGRPEFGPGVRSFPVEVTLSTTAMRTSCWSLEYFMDDATRSRRGRSPDAGEPT